MANTQVGGLSLEPTNSGNSITQFLRSIEGLTGTSGQSAFTSGQNLLGPSQQLLGAGQGTFQTGVQSMAPALDYLTRLVKGDSADTDQALSPQIDAIKGNFNEARKLIASQPRGGGKSTLLAEAPFEQAKQISNVKNTARTAATSQLSQLSETLASLGLQQSDVGLGEGQLALGESSLGAQLLGTSAGIAETTRGQDFEQQAALQSMIASLATGAAKVLIPPANSDNNSGNS